MLFSPFSHNSLLPVTTTIMVEPIYSVLTAMSLLTAPNLDAAAEPLLAEAATRLTADQRKTNRIIFEWFGSALLPIGNHISFPNLVTAITSTSPIDLRDRTLQSWLEASSSEDVSARAILADEQRFVALAKSVNPDSPIDQDRLSEVYALITDPPSMQKMITTHLHTLWEAEFAEEWQKKLSMMRYCADELNSRSWPTESASAVIQAFIRRSVPDEITTQLSGVRQINVVPSPTIHLHGARLGSSDTLWLFMLADFWQLPMRTEPIKRGEVKGPASALADDTRLQILELLAANDELRAQEIIAQLGASQSTVSRHLKQLSSAQFITEKRAGDANKIYQINRARVSEFAYSLSALLSKENAQVVLNDIRLEQPPELQPYLNREGLLTQWPAKWKNQEAVLDYLIEKFDLEKKYTEKQVNELLNEWHTYDDPVYLRRALIETRQLLRTPNGAQYWRAEA